MNSRDGMNYAPTGKPAPVVGPGEFVIAAAALDHGHIYGMCNGLIEAGATLKWVYDRDPAKVAQFQKTYPESQWIADDLAAMDQAITTLEALTKPFITLSADDKSGLVKMGDKSVAFCQQTALVLAQNKEVLPQSFDYSEMEDDLAAYAALQSRVLRIREVLAKMDDTQTALGSDVMVAASEGYALMKLFGKAEGLSELQQAMRVRRPGRRRKGDTPAE